MPHNCTCQCCNNTKELRKEIRRLKRINTASNKVIMLLKRKINATERLIRAEKTLSNRTKKDNGAIKGYEKDESSDEDIISDTSVEPLEVDNKDVAPINELKLNLENN